mgnify:CR=1 FL=1
MSQLPMELEFDFFNSSQPDWSLINPQLRKHRFGLLPVSKEDNPHVRHSSFIYANGFAQRISDAVNAGEIRLSFIADNQAGYWLRNFYVPADQKLRVFITSYATQMTVCDFNFYLDKNSQLELRYFGNSILRQAHARFRVTHTGKNSRSLIKTATLASKNAASTAMVQVDMPAGCSGSSSEVRSYNWSDGGRVGSLPIIDVGEPDVSAAHGNVVYSVDPEAIFLLQLRGIGQEDARKQMLYGQMISDMLDKDELVDWGELWVFI